MVIKYNAKPPKNKKNVSIYSRGESILTVPEDIPFPSVMRALMEYFKQEDFGCRCRGSH
jgi:hypothetical protein